MPAGAGEWRAPSLTFRARRTSSRCGVRFCLLPVAGRARSRSFLVNFQRPREWPLTALRRRSARRRASRRFYGEVRAEGRPPPDSAGPPLSPARFASARERGGKERLPHPSDAKGGGGKWCEGGDRPPIYQPELVKWCVSADDRIVVRYTAYPSHTLPNITENSSHTAVTQLSPGGERPLLPST